MKKSCFIAGRRTSLFKDLMANLLNGLIDDLDIQENQADDFEGLLTEISNADPTLVLLDETSPFSGDSFLVQLLIHKPGLPVIVVSEDSNLMHVVQKETRVIGSSNDLVDAVNLMSGTEFMR